MHKLAAVLVVLVALVPLEALPASAAVPTWTHPCSDDLDVAACERLTFLAETMDSDSAKLDGLGAKLDTIHDDLTASSGPSEISGTVALATGDADRLDLLVVGVFLLPGLFLGIWIGRRFYGEMGRW